MVILIFGKMVQVVNCVLEYTNSFHLLTIYPINLVLLSFHKKTPKSNNLLKLSKSKNRLKNKTK